MATYLGLEAVGWDGMLENWWEKLLLGLLLATSVIGILYLIFLLSSTLRKHLKRRRSRQPVPRVVTRYLDQLKLNSRRISYHSAPLRKPKTFGVFLGSFSIIPTEAESKILTQWDLLIVDPCQQGVLHALQSSNSAQKIGRIDVQSIVRIRGRPGKADLLDSLTLFVQRLTTSFVQPGESQSPFTGLLLANWQPHFPPSVCNGLVQFASGLGLNVYLELSAPAYLTELECREIDLEAVSGVVCRNGTILPDGDRRNYYQMTEMRGALRALASQSTIKGTTVMMWESVDNNVQLDHGVAKRSFNWCRYNSAISWIGPKAALTNAEIATTRSLTGEPLGALMWLKDDETVAVHDVWRFNDSIQQHGCGDETIYDRLDDLVPDLAEKLSLLLPAYESGAQSPAIVVDGFDRSLQERHATSDPLSISPLGHDYTGLGCFQIGLDCTQKDFADVVEAQRRLKELNLLKRVKVDDLHRIAKHFSALNHNSWTGLPGASQAVIELVQLLNTSSTKDHDTLRVWIGLHSGFRTSTDNQFAGLYDFDSDRGGLDLYVSAKATDLPGTILHTFLSSRHFTRGQCLVAELALGRQMRSLSDKWDMPARFVQQIEQLTPTELILLCQRLGSSQGEDTLGSKIRNCCEYQLLEVPTLAQLRTLNAAAYIRGEVSAQELIESRFAWYREQGCQIPDMDAAIAVFLEVDKHLSRILIDCKSKTLAETTSVLQEVLQKGQIDAGADIFALSIFCAFRKLAITETYLEVLDRNPLPNEHPDQAGCFAEMFATGSRCEAFFDMTPNVLGRILSDRYQAYYKINQPPRRDDKSTEQPTAYASKQIDRDPDARAVEAPWYYQVTFLGIFAFPALIDILLLTTIGRGLYLTTYMTETEKSMATTALMVSLFLTGAIGTWVGSGGSYYLFSMAFPAMNMFVLTRWIAGIAICLAGGVIALIFIAIVKGIYAGVIFFLYLVILTTYLSTLATLAIYQLPGFNFQSGRTTVMACIPILFISPILTLWVHHDALVYLCVLGGFLVSLLVGARRVITQWSTWYLDIPCASDGEIIKWYKDTKMSEKSILPEGVTDIAATPIPRRALLEDVLRERNRHFWTKPTTDEFVLKLANGFAATAFLMDWYCQYSRTDMPFKYSTTWNLQCRAAIDTLKSMQKGLKLHNAFVHWRHAGDEVYCGVLYFVIALMDKWVALISGGSLVGLSAADSSTFRLAVGFGLAYYLISAIALDAVAQPLWPSANKLAPEPVSSFKALQDVVMKHANTRRRVFWTNLAKFFLMHIWGIALSTALMWVFEDSRDAILLYVAYMGAYTGLLFYQYNRIFTGTLALPDLLIAAALGLIVGPVLHHVLPQFNYSSVIALAVATWTAALLTLKTAKIGLPRAKKTKEYQKITEEPVFFSSCALKPDSESSQKTLSDVFHSVLNLPAEARFRMHPSTYPGVEVMKVLLHETDFNISQKAAFDSAKRLKQHTAELWTHGATIVDLVASPDTLPKDRKLKSISRVVGNQLHMCVFVGRDQLGIHGMTDIGRNCKLIAESLLQATAEARLGFTHEHSALAELFVVREDENTGAFLPEGVKRQLASPTERVSFIRGGDKALLRNLLLGLNCDTEWDLLPKKMRSFLLKRCTGAQCFVTSSHLEWVRDRFCEGALSDPQQYIARCNLGVDLTVAAVLYAEALAATKAERCSTESNASSYKSYSEQAFISNPDDSNRPLLDTLKAPFLHFYHALRVAMKFFVVSIVADAEFQRELDYVMAGKPWIVRWPATIFLDGIWIFCKTAQQMVLPIVLIHGREKVSRLYKDMKGMNTVLEKHRVVIEAVGSPSTCFFKRQPDGTVQLHQYSGRHNKEPKGFVGLLSINTYTKDLVLQQRDEYANGTSVNSFTYEYAQDARGLTTKLPISRHCTKGTLNGHIAQYDKRGYITSGSYIKDNNFTEFTWNYRENARFDDELLRAEFVLAHMTIKVSWYFPSPNSPKKLDKAIPNSNVTEATFIQGPDVYYSKWTYDHKSHPIIETMLNGQAVETPAMIQHDWFGILKKPTKCSFISDNPLLLFHSTTPSTIARLLGLNKKWMPISTSRARAHLWKSWKDTKDLDAVTTRWLDEWALRSDPILRPYWRARDLGRLTNACNYLDEQADTVMARVDIDPEISSWTPLAFKTSDLYTFGQGGDTGINTRSVSTQLQDSKSTLNVLAMDTGTWPNEGGGVSACRRDMVNDLKTIKWNIVAECANDYGFPKFQIERNVQSLTVLPLWGLDFLTPSHGIFENTLDAAVQERSHNTSRHDIKTKFLPILRTLVRCARAIKLDPSHIEDSTKALLDLNAYFESSRHWSDIWMSEIVKEEWRSLWLSEDMENSRPISDWLEAEYPTMTHLDNALDMWQRYLFVFSLPVPKKIPDVFQASHHFAGASYGVICKIKRGCAFHVWDHCISWREATVFLSSAMSFDAPFVCTSLISLSRILSVLTLHHADVVLPCADFFNPAWEVELGSQEGTICHRRTYARKIDPVVNGICNMEKFKPIEKIKSEKPTAVMLSHVRFVKDIKNAVLAADIIINEWGFTDYRLDIYGDMERAPSYATECQEIIASKALGDHVLLRGLGSPFKVLEEAWLFLNSSISEGLPLAMGEAALTGVPVVCTDVGASFRVVTDPDTGKRFSAVVAPNDSYSLAKAQVNILGMLDEWSEYADDPEGYRPKLPLQPSAEDTRMIAQRMYEKAPQRQRLGMKGRANVINSFSSERYLREHEQMLWIGKHQSESYNSRTTPLMSQSVASLFCDCGDERCLRG